MYVEVTMRNFDDEIVGFGVATIDSELFARERVIQVSNFRSAAAPDDDWPLPPQHAFVLETTPETILADADLRRAMRNDFRWHLTFGGVAVCVGAFLLAAWWPTVPLVLAGLVWLALGVSSLRRLDIWRRPR